MLTIICIAMQKISNYLTENLIAFLSVFFAAYIMVLFGEFEIAVGTYFYLPLGAKILMYLLFGFRVLPGVLLACIGTGVVLFNSWNDHLLLGSMAACAGALAPIIAMWVMRITQMCNFSNLKNIDFRHVIFLIAFTSVISALLKFFIYMQSITMNINAVDFITHYITGDVLGSLLVIYLVLKLLIPLITRLLRPSSA